MKNLLKRIGGPTAPFTKLEYYQLNTPTLWRGIVLSVKDINLNIKSLPLRPSYVLTYLKTFYLIYLLKQPKVHQTKYEADTRGESLIKSIQDKTKITWKYVYDMRIPIGELVHCINTGCEYKIRDFPAVINTAEQEWKIYLSKLGLAVPDLTNFKSASTTVGEYGIPSDLYSYLPSDNPFKQDSTPDGNGRKILYVLKDTVAFLKEGYWGVWTGKNWEIGGDEVMMYPVSQALLELKKIAPNVRSVQQSLAKLETPLQKQKIISALKTILPRTKSLRDFDRKGYLLNVDNGVIDLREGKLLKHSPEYMCSNIIPYGYDEGNTSGRFKEFLDSIVPKVEDQNRLMRYLGYMLTGYSREQKALFISGTAANGKTTFTNLMLKLMGSYGIALPNTTMTGGVLDTRRLWGKRLAVIQEPPVGRRVNSTTFKILTGGDILEDGEAVSTKLVLAGNYLPLLPDEPAVFRRVWHIDFPNSFLENPNLLIDEELEEEIEGVLTSLVQEAVVYLKRGLRELERRRSIVL